MHIVPKTLVLFAVAVYILSANYCLAGAWTEPKGGMYEKVSLIYLTENKFNDITIANYLEYGLTDNLSLVSSIFYKFLWNQYSSTVYDNNSNNGAYLTTDTTTRSNGFGDVDLGLKQKLADGDFGVVSHKLMVKIPGLYDRNDPLPLGNGRFEVDYRALYGLSMWRWFPGYINFESGYRFRFGGFSDQFRYGAEFGSDLTQRIQVKLTFDGILSMRNGDNRANTGLNPVAAKLTSKSVASCGGNGAITGLDSTTSDNRNQQFLNLVLTYKLTDRWGAQLGYSPTLRTGDTSAATSYAAGLYYLLR